MPKNPGNKGAAKKKRAENVKARTEAKYAARSAKSNGSGASQRKGKGLAIPAHMMEQQSSDSLRAIIATNAPGSHLARTVLERREKQAAQQRYRQQSPQPTDSQT